MGPKFTEGSITQHLAKLRKRMVAEHIPVPPALKRGYHTKTASTVYSNGNPVIEYEYVIPLYTETPKHVPNANQFYSTAGMTPTPTGPGMGVGEFPDYQQTTPTKSGTKRSGKGRSSARSKGKVRARGGGMSDDDDDVFMAALDGDSDGDYGAPPKKKAKTPRRAKVGKSSASPGLEHLPEVKVEGEDVAMNEAISPTGPAGRTRGVKQDYSMLGNGEDDDDAVPSENESPIDDESPEAEEDLVDLADTVDYEGEEDVEGGVDLPNAQQFAREELEKIFPVSEAFAGAARMAQARSNMNLNVSRSVTFGFVHSLTILTGHVFRRQSSFHWKWYFQYWKCLWQQPFQPWTCLQRYWSECGQLGRPAQCRSSPDYDFGRQSTLHATI